MKKSKKSLRNKSKIIFIYGLPASGKLTVGKELSKIAKIPLCHNHMIFDLVFKIFPWESKDGQEFREKLYMDIVKIATKRGSGVIFTHAHADNIKFPFFGTSNNFVKKIEKIAKLNKAEFLPVYLTCSDTEFLKRAVHPSRKLFSKTNTVKGMKKWLVTRKPNAKLPVENTLVIDNTNISPKKVAQMIKKHFDL